MAKPHWTRCRVHQILTNPKYIGPNVYNRTSNKLYQKIIQNPSDLRIRKEEASKPLISPDLFTQTQTLVRLSQSGHDRLGHTRQSSRPATACGKNYGADNRGLPYYAVQIRSRRVLRRDRMAQTGSQL